MHEAFKVHLLNPHGIAKAGRLANLFDNHLALIEEILGSSARYNKNFGECVKHMQLASFFAKKAMAENPLNQSPREEVLQPGLGADSADMLKNAQTHTDASPDVAPGPEIPDLMLRGVSDHVFMKELNRRMLQRGWR